ncbi:MAG: helix-turn-helix transcriptional regulator [Planctomycetota bacterium]
MSHFGHLLDSLLEARELTQNRLASESGMDPATISRWRNAAAFGGRAHNLRDVLAVIADHRAFSAEDDQALRATLGDTYAEAIDATMLKSTTDAMKAETHGLLDTYIETAGPVPAFAFMKASVDGLTNAQGRAGRKADQD